jgi:hypothetical protein
VQYLGGGGGRWAGIEKQKRMLFLTGRHESSGRGRGHQIKTGNELFCLCVRDERPAGNAPSDQEAFVFE